jgi:hypothetical protein
MERGEFDTCGRTHTFILADDLHGVLGRAERARRSRGVSRVRRLSKACSIDDPFLFMSQRQAFSEYHPRRLKCRKQTLYRGGVAEK